MAFIKHNYNIGPLTWLKVGGVVQTLFIPKNLEEILDFLKTNTQEILILGAVSNSLILDGHLNKTIIKTTNLNQITLLNDHTIEAQCGVLDKVLSNFALEHGIGGLEFLDSIPGTIGGNILTNAGCYGREIQDILVEVKCITKSGDIEILSNSDLKFSYRKGYLPENILMVYSVIIKGNPQDYHTIKSTMIHMENQRILTQPIGISTCGCTFKNPSPDKKAWQLIKESGAHLLKVNQVGWSSIHCNFLENHGHSANDIYELCQQTRQLVLSKTGYNLELEMFIYGQLT